MEKPWAGEFPNDKPEPRCCGSIMIDASATDDDGEHISFYVCGSCDKEDHSDR